MRLLYSYDFLVVASGAALLAAIAAVIGCFSIYRGQSLIGDALGHASYPGVVLAFMLFRSRNPLFLCLGAAASAAFAYALILWLQSDRRLAPDAVLATVLSGMFGLGMVLKTRIQGDPGFQNVSQSGLRLYIFGSAAFMTRRDVWMLLGGAALLFLLLLLFRRPLQYSSFDPGYAASLGISERGMGAVMLFLTVTVIALGIRTVGAILISAFLLMPGVAVSGGARSIGAVLCRAAGMAVFSALFGCAVSTAVPGISTGPMMIVWMGLFTLLVFVWRRRKEHGWES
mgnify:FL=1